MTESKCVGSEDRLLITFCAAYNFILPWLLRTRKDFFTKKWAMRLLRPLPAIPIKNDRRSGRYGVIRNQRVHQGANFLFVASQCRSV